MLFWIFAIVMTFLVAVIVLSPILRSRSDETITQSSDIAVYRDQLKELDADIARGNLSEAEAETSRAEISRRLLAADMRDADDASFARPSISIAAFLGFTFFMTGGALGLYLFIGAPGVPDYPLAERMQPIPQAEAERRFVESGGQQPRALAEREEELLTRLRNVLEERPDDITGYRLLVQTLSSIEDYSSASAAQMEVIQILGDDAKAEDYAEAAEMMIFAAGGYVSPEADAMLARALELDARDLRARYYSGLSLSQTGKPELAMRLWAELLSEGDPNAPWKEPIRAQMRNLASSTGLPLPEEELRGPTQSDVEAASEMSESDRQDMIRSMVDGLSDRLATEGGTPAEWARLIRALSVLGDSDQAQAIYEEARSTFAGDADALATISDTAKSLGIE